MPVIRNCDVVFFDVPSTYDCQRNRCTRNTESMWL